MMHVVVLGAGRVGAVMARDLAPDFKVTVADRSEEALARVKAWGLATCAADLGSPAGVKAAVADADLVVGAVPGFMGFPTAKAVIEAGKTLVDISFFDEDAFELDALAKEQGITAIVDVGVAPGAGNIILGDCERQWDRITRFECLVGGLPIVRKWPFEYQAGFSPIDVIEEYTRPARFIEHGEMVVRPALSEPELVDLPGVGTLEAFNTDGLRSILHTVKAPNMKEKTLRYPGHIEKMRMLRETGFFSKDPIRLGNQEIVPLELTAKLLFAQWQMKEGDEDLTVMRVIVEGELGQKAMKRTYHMLDHFDTATGTSAMARTTGFTCTSAVRMMAAGKFSRKGICPPEYIGREAGCWDFIRAELAERGVLYREE